MNRTFGTWVVALAGVVPLACTALLGDDFSIVSGEGGRGGSHDTGGGGEGGHADTGGGGEGGDGGGAIVDYSCDWDTAEHRLVASQEAAPSESFGGLWGARRGPDAMRGVVERFTASGAAFFDVYSLDGGPNIRLSSWPARQVHAVERLSASEIGVLYTDPVIPTLRLLVIDDGSADGADASDHVLIASSSFPGLDPAGSPFRAMMAPVPSGLDDWGLDVVVSHLDTAGDHVIRYGHYDGATPITTLHRLNAPSLGELNDDDTNPIDMLHAGGRSYAYFGDSDATLGHSVWVVDASVNGFVAPATIAQSEGFFDLVVAGDHANVGMFDTGPPIRFLTGAVAPADLAGFTPADLTAAAEFQGLLDLPVFEADARWHDDILAMIGPDGDESIDMAYYFLDNAGRERAHGALDFTLVLPAEEDREGIGALVSVLRGPPLDETGGTLHVLWAERHTKNGLSFDVLYYDRLRCTPD